MTIEEVIREVETWTVEKVTPETQLKDLGLDSLEFLELMIALNIPDALVPSMNTVGDLQMTDVYDNVPD